MAGPTSSLPESEHTPGVPGLDQEMPARRRKNYSEAFDAVKAWLEREGLASGDEAITNAKADELVRLVRDV